MACVNADGSLTPIAQKVLASVDQPASVEVISQRSDVPLYRVRASMRELVTLGMVEEIAEQFTITDKGRTFLAASQN